MAAAWLPSRALYGGCALAACGHTACPPNSRLLAYRFRWRAQTAATAGPISAATPACPPAAPAAPHRVKRYNGKNGQYLSKFGGVGVFARTIAITADARECCCG